MEQDVGHAVQKNFKQTKSNPTPNNKGLDKTVMCSHHANIIEPLEWRVTPIDTGIELKSFLKEVAE